MKSMGDMPDEHGNDGKCALWCLTMLLLSEDFLGCADEGCEDETRPAVENLSDRVVASLFFY